MFITFQILLIAINGEIAGTAFQTILDAQEKGVECDAHAHFVRGNDGPRACPSPWNQIGSSARSWMGCMSAAFMN